MLSEFAVHFENGECAIYHITSDEITIQKTRIIVVSEERGLNIIGDEAFFEITSIMIYDNDSYTIYGVLI